MAIKNPPKRVCWVRFNYLALAKIADLSSFADASALSRVTDPRRIIRSSIFAVAMLMAANILPINASRLPKPNSRICFETSPKFTTLCVEYSETGIDVSIKNALITIRVPTIARMIPKVFIVVFLRMIIFDGKNYRQVGNRKGRRK